MHILGIDMMTDSEYTNLTDSPFPPEGQLLRFIEADD